MHRTPLTRLRLLAATLPILLLAACGADNAPTTAPPTATLITPTANVNPTSTVDCGMGMMAVSCPPDALVRLTQTAATARASGPGTFAPYAPFGTAAAMQPSAGTVTGGSAGAGGTLTVFAAASLTESFAQVKTNFERANPGVRVEYNFAGSQALVAQLTQGARADVFASADGPNMDAAVKAGVIAGTPSTFVRNKLVLILPKDNRAGIRTLQDLAKPGIKFVTGQESVPVGRYTLQVLDNYGKLPEYGADFRARVQRNIVSQEDNVKAIVQKVGRGEADAGVVYATDAQAARDQLTLIEIPDAQNVVAAYPVAVVKDARQAALAQRFVDYLLSTEGQTTLGTYGFAPAK